ncbi:ricin-type beta-trefoil lectin domain protein [Streptomyces sp. NPDC002054]|uniref:ricin-type beta-trefoil lectin domain protein n=1 Tax=Streptomyces sp. NPDC002054 TaxID=3154663 RepID=UPI00332AF2A2
MESDGTNRSQLVLFQGAGPTGGLREPIVLVLSPSGWENLTLIAPGDATGDGLPDLWARDNTAGTVYQYANQAGNPAALGDHSKRTTIAQGLKASTHPLISSSGDTSADGLPDLWARDSRHRLVTLNGKATSGKVTGFGPAMVMGDSRISASHWKLSEGTGTTAVDLRGRSNATLSSGANWADDTVAGTATKVLQLDGISGTATTTAAAVDTTRSFTISTWAKPDTLGGVVASQDGTRASGFLLWADQGDGTWRFGMAQKDSDGWNYDQTTMRNDAAKVQTGVWTQLTATYHEPTGQIALYVNGTLAGTGHHAKANTWKATGSLVLGRYKYDGKPDVHFDGRISNLAVYHHSTVPTAWATKLVSGINPGKCADNNAGSTADGNRIQIWDCNDANGGTSQKFDIGDTGELRTSGKCVDAANAGTANGTLVQLWTCNGTGAQQWLPTAQGGFYHPASNRCLDLPQGRIMNGTQLQLRDCNHTSPQRWTIPGLASPLSTAD